MSSPDPNPRRNAWVVFLENGPMLHCEPQRVDGIYVNPDGIHWSVLTVAGERHEQFVGPRVAEDRHPFTVLQQLEEWWELKTRVGEG